jgi:uncharacterized Zn finger protein
MLINKNMLTRLAGEAAYQRGLSVYKSGAVLSVKEKAGYVFAKVEGTVIYQVKLQITNKTLDGSCDCPASENFDFCKHCVATALFYKEEQSQLKNADPNVRIQAYINQLSEQAAKEVLFQLISDDDLLTNKWQLKADSALGTIDIKQLKKQITKALPYRSLWEYAKVRHYFANAEAALDPIFDLFPELDVKDVFSLTQYISLRLNKLLEQLDDSGGYRFALEHQINETLTTTFKRLPWSANKKSQFLLQALINEDEYMVYPEIPGDFLDDSIPEVSMLFYQAIQEKWDALPNLRNDASYDEKRPYNNLLYILLHQAEAEKNIAVEIALKTKVANNVRDFIELAELNLAQGLSSTNIEQADYWLEKAQIHQDKFRHATEIKRLTITLLEAKQQPQEALTIQWQIFSKTEQFNDYQKLQELTKKSGIDEAKCYQQAETILIKNSAVKPRNHWDTLGYNLIGFYLKSNQVEKAAAYAQNNQIDVNQLQLIAKQLLPLNIPLAFEFYQRVAMVYPQQSNNQAYQQTIDVLIELKQVLPDDIRWHDKFKTLLTEIKLAYKPKRNLMKLLEQNFT